MSATTTTVHTLYRPGDKVRFRYGSPAYLADPSLYAGSLYGTYEGVLSTDPSVHSLRVTVADQTVRPEGITESTALNLVVIGPDGTTPANAIHDVTLIERYGLPVRLLNKDDHPDVFVGRYRQEVTHALVFTSTTSPSGNEVLSVPYTPAAVEAGWRIGGGNLADCGLPADHALLGEQGWWVEKGALREAGVTLAEDETEPTELERLRAEVERLTGENRRLAQADENLRREVGTVAMQYAREHDWCGVVREALSDMGIEPVEQKHEVWLSIRVRATGISSSSDPSRDWTRHSISVDEGGIASAIEFDSDWEDVEVDAYSVDVEVDSVDPLDD